MKTAVGFRSFATWRLLVTLLALAANAGCEQRYVGGPVAILTGERPTHGFAGITFVSPEELTLDEVVVDGPADAAGAKVGDRIVACDKQPATTVGEFLQIIRSTSPGDEVVLELLRSDVEVELKITLCDFSEMLRLRKAQADSTELEP